MLQSQPGGGSLRQGVRVPRRELQHGAGREGDLPHPQVSPTIFALLNFTISEKVDKEFQYF